jgi:hypothetical protein
MLIASLTDPAIVVPRQPTRPTPPPRQMQPGETEAIAGCFIASRTGADPLTRAAYRQLETQTDRQFAALTTPAAPTG